MKLPKARRPALNARGNTIPLSAAKTYLGRILQKVSQGETVYICRGSERFIIQRVPEVDPIPMRPPGYFGDLYTSDDVRELNTLSKASVIRPPKDLE